MPKTSPLRAVSGGFWLQATFVGFQSIGPDRMAFFSKKKVTSLNGPKWGHLNKKTRYTPPNQSIENWRFFLKKKATGLWRVGGPNPIRSNRGLKSAWFRLFLDPLGGGGAIGWFQSERGYAGGTRYAKTGEVSRSVRANTAKL